MGSRQAGLGVVQKEVACVQFDTLEFGMLIEAGSLQHVKDLYLKLMGVKGYSTISPLPLAFQW